METEPETTVVGEASNGDEAVSAVRALRPDVVLMDIRMPVLDGIEATRRIIRAQPGTRILILTTFGLDSYVYDALRAGASGFMLKDAPRRRRSPPPSGSSLAATHCSRPPSRALSSMSSLVGRPRDSRWCR
jgi:DNA-binding NarL/FixJ family response regulator